MKTKTIRNPIPLFETKALEDYLSDMSEKGLVLKEVNYNGTFTFEKSEPKRIRYAVDLIEEYTKDQEEYLALCEAAGWHFIGTDYRESLHIFYADREDAASLQSDPLVEAEILKKTVQKNKLSLMPVYFIFLFILVLLVTLGIDGVGSFFLFPSNSLLWIIFLLLHKFINHIIEYFMCRRKIKNLKSYKKLPNRPFKKILKKYRINKVIEISLVILFFILNITIYFELKEVDKIPAQTNTFSLEKLGLENPDTDVFKDAGNIFLSKNYELWQNINQNPGYGLNMHYYECRFEFVAKDIYKKEVLAESINKFTIEECKDMNISEGKYYINQEKKVIGLLIRDKKKVYNICLNGFDTLDANLKSVIRTVL